MRSRSRRGAVFAFVLGAALAAPLWAWSGGDLCAPFHESQWEEAELVLTSWTVDGVAQTQTASGSLRSWTPQSSGVDDTHAYATLPDARDPATARELYLTRQP